MYIIAKNSAVSVLRDLADSGIISINNAKSVIFHEEKRKHPSFGCMKGMLKYMSDDFNEPLEEFKEYM